MARLALLLVLVSTLAACASAGVSARSGQESFTASAKNGAIRAGYDPAEFSDDDISAFLGAACRRGAVSRTTKTPTAGGRVSLRAVCRADTVFVTGSYRVQRGPDGVIVVEGFGTLPKSKGKTTTQQFTL